MVSKKVLRRLLCIARQVLEIVLNDILQLSKRVEECENQIMAQVLPRAETWKGDGAESFRNELQNVLVPMIRQLIQALLGVHGGINSAQQTIVDADTKAAAQVDELAEKFRSITTF